MTFGSGWLSRASGHASGPRLRDPHCAASGRRAPARGFLVVPRNSRVTRAAAFGSLPSRGAPRELGGAGAAPGVGPAGRRAPGEGVRAGRGRVQPSPRPFRASAPPSDQ